MVWLQYVCAAGCSLETFRGLEGVGGGWSALLIGGWTGVFLRVCCFDVVETSYEGHMVDALASRADEGRWSLR